MYLCIEERDLSESEGLSPNVGWTHYFDYPSMVKVKEYFHVNNENKNDSGQSFCIGNIQYQINCISTVADWRNNFFIWERDTNRLIESRSIVSDQNGEVLRLLGISAKGNTFYIGGMDHPSYAYNGIYSYNLNSPGNVAYLRRASSFTADGIGIHGGFLFHCAEEDGNLRIVDLNSWNLVRTIALPDDGEFHFRGCTVIGSEIIVGNVTNHRMYWLDEGTFVVSKYFDVSGFMHDAGNEMPYGCWMATQEGFMKTKL